MPLADQRFRVTKLDDLKIGRQYSSWNYQSNTEKTKLLKAAFPKRIELEHFNFKRIETDPTMIIFVRQNEDDSRHLQALMTGLPNTPFDSGLFMFEIYLPDRYPEEPPVVHAVMRGQPSYVPNIYSAGKVMLSILNTWSSSGGQKWSDDLSVYEILVSLQTHIFVDEPYFLEYGKEREFSTPEGARKSNDYNTKITPTIIELGFMKLIRDPPVGFEDVIDEYFLTKSEYITGFVFPKLLAMLEMAGPEKKTQHEKAEAAFMEFIEWVGNKNNEIASREKKVDTGIDYTASIASL